MGDQKKKTDYAGAFKKAATSKPAKWIGGALAVYYGLITVGGGTAVLMGNSTMPEDFDRDLDNKAYVHKINKSECYFVDPTLEEKITFTEYPSGYLTGLYRLFTPFVETDRVYHDLGSMPVLSEAPCDVLKDDKIVTKREAFELMDQWKSDLKNGEKAQKALENMESGKGFFGTHYIRKAAPKP